MMFLVAALIGLALGLTTAARPATSCDVLSARMLDLPFQAFDQGPDGWRRLSDSFLCGSHAAPTIAAYWRAHGDLTPNESALLFWHEGQLRAGLGQGPEAVALFKQSRWSGEPEWWRLYREATIAFIQRDRAALERFRAMLASTSEQPPNLDVVDGLIRCFDRPYAEAYACRSGTTSREQGGG